MGKPGDPVRRTVQPTLSKFFAPLKSSTGATAAAAAPGSTSAGATDRDEAVMVVEQPVKARVDDADHTPPCSKRAASDDEAEQDKKRVCRVLPASTDDVMEVDADTPAAAPAPVP